MYCAIFIIGAALPSLILAKIATVKNAQDRCNNTEVTGAGDKFIQCFTDMVEHTSTRDNTHKDCKDIKSTLATYTTVANESCYKDDERSKITVSGVILNNLIKYSLNYSAFNVFVANGGPVCINNVKENITKDCLVSNVGVIEGDDKYYKLWRMSTAGINRIMCERAKKLKECVVSAIKSSETCKKETKVFDVATYVNSLFEFMLVRCPILVPAAQAAPKDPSKQTRLYELSTKDSGNVTALLGVILALVLISMLYVVIRDCRRSSGKTWKPYTIPMTARSGN